MVLFEQKNNKCSNNNNDKNNDNNNNTVEGPVESKNSTGSYTADHRHLTITWFYTVLRSYNNYS